MAAAPPSPFSASSFDMKSLNGTIVTPGGIEDIIISDRNTLNGNYHSDVTEIVHPDRVRFANGAAVATLSVDLFNNFDPDYYNTPNVYAYITGTDPSGRLVFVNNGQLIYPSSGGSTTPKPITENIGFTLAGYKQTKNVKVPISITSGRNYFSAQPLKFFMIKGGDGKDSLVQPDEVNVKDPNAATYWGFVEFTYGQKGDIFANLSFVDFIGIPTGMKLTKNDGPDQITKGFPKQGTTAAAYYIGGSSFQDGVDWIKLVMQNSKNDITRILSPNKYMLIDPSLFGNYWDGYVNKVWDHYTSNTLVIDTQKFGKLNCRVSGGQMNCDQGVKFTKPSSADIWGCNSGPFANVGSEVQKNAIARLCAAFVRTTLLLPGGNVQPSLPSSKYYPNPGNTNHNDRSHWYSWGTHYAELDGKGYAFSYDDVNPNGEHTEGSVSSGSPKVLTFYVNGYPQ